MKGKEERGMLFQFYSLTANRAIGMEPPGRWPGKEKEAGAFNLYSGLYISPCVLAQERRNEPFINF